MLKIKQDQAPLTAQRTRVRRNAAIRRLRYAFAGSSLGRILVAAVPDGLCALFMGNEPGELLATLRREFPAAACLPADDNHLLPMRDVRSLVEDPAGGCRLSLHLCGTDFQRRVWQALRAIPAGETISYGALAARLGMPRASRAVAAACAANCLAVAVPCHRVVRADGGLAGYRWGADRKLELLERERSPQAQGLFSVSPRSRSHAPAVASPSQ